MSGKGSSPRNVFSQDSRENYEGIQWDGKTNIRGKFSAKRGLIVFRPKGKARKFLSEF